MINQLKISKINFIQMGIKHELCWMGDATLCTVNVLKQFSLHSFLFRANCRVCVVKKFRMYFTSGKKKEYIYIYMDLNLK